MPETNVRKGLRDRGGLSVSGNTGQRITVKMVMWLPVFLSIILKKDVTNGIITQDTVYLRTLYQELSREHKI